MNQLETSYFTNLVRTMIHIAQSLTIVGLTIRSFDAIQLFGQFKPNEAKQFIVKYKQILSPI